MLVPRMHFTEATTLVKLRIVCVDPGINLGVSCLEVDVTTKQITTLDTHTLSLNDIANAHYSEMVESQGLVVTRIVVIEDALKKYASFWLPDFIVHETAFSAHGRRFGGSIESFASLRENILGIKLAACRYDPTLPVIAVNPSTVKYCVVGEKSDDKNQMKLGLLSKTDLDLSSVNVDELDQHAIDSIGIGYTFIQKQIFGDSENERSKRSKNAKGNKNKSTRR